MLSCFNIFSWKGITSLLRLHWFCINTVFYHWYSRHCHIVARWPYPLLTISKMQQNVRYDFLKCWMSSFFYFSESQKWYNQTYSALTEISEVPWWKDFNMWQRSFFAFWHQRVYWWFKKQEYKQTLLRMSAFVAQTMNGAPTDYF